MKFMNFNELSAKFLPSLNKMGLFPKTLWLQVWSGWSDDLAWSEFLLCLYQYQMVIFRDILSEKTTVLLNHLTKILAEATKNWVIWEFFSLQNPRPLRQFGENSWPSALLRVKPTPGPLIIFLNLEGKIYHFVTFFLVWKNKATVEPQAQKV